MRKEDMIRIKAFRIGLAISAIVIGACLFLSIPIFKRSKCVGIKEPFFEPLKITEYAAGDIPCISLKAQNKMTVAKVDLGYSSGISLPADFMHDLKKKFVSKRSSYGMRGKRYQSDVYELPGISIGNLSLAPAHAAETNLEFERDSILVQDEQSPSDLHLGRLGWRLFYNFNLFLDFENDSLAFCDSFKTLQSRVALDSFVEIPLLLDRDLVEFMVVTEKGPLRCVVDTGCTWSLLNKNLDDSLDNHMIFHPDNANEHQALNPTNDDLSAFCQDDFYEVSDFKIGEKNFGPFTFRKIKMPAQVDAVIGMDFLFSHPLFIDFSERKIYFLKTVIPK